MKVTLLIILFSLATLFLYFKKDVEIAPKDVTEYKKQVEVKDFFQEKFSKPIKLRGFSEASRIVILKAQVNGKVSSKQFDKGLFYKAGSVLLLIDPEDKVARVKEMEALLNQRKKEFEVAESLHQKGFRSDVKLSQSRTNFENALALYEKSQVELNNTRVSIPFDSNVEDSYVELGDYLKKGDSIAKIVDLDPIIIEATANEKEINYIKLNQNAKVLVGNNLVNGSVSYISKTSDAVTRNFKIQVKIKNKRNIILSGLSSEIIIGGPAQNAYFVPSSLVTLNNQGQVGVKVIINERVKFIPVEILSDTGDGFWINAEELDKLSKVSIITQGQDFTVDGEIVDTIKKND